MKTAFEKMRAHRARWVQILPQPQELPQNPAEVPYMEIDGVRYVEAQETDSELGCFGCVFLSNKNRCDRAEGIAAQAFGDECIRRRVIYIKAENQ